MIYEMKEWKLTEHNPKRNSYLSFIPYNSTQHRIKIVPKTRTKLIQVQRLRSETKMRSIVEKKYCHEWLQFDSISQNATPSAGILPRRSIHPDPYSETIVIIASWERKRGSKKQKKQEFCSLPKEKNNNAHSQLKWL